MSQGGVPRALHPGAWWLWALGLATAAVTVAAASILLLVLHRRGRLAPLAGEAE